MTISAVWPYGDFKNLKPSDQQLVGNLVELILEPENKHDSNAIMIMYKGRKMGYVAKNHNLILNHLLEQRDLCTVWAMISDVDLNLGVVKITYTLEI